MVRERGSAVVTTVVAVVTFAVGMGAGAVAVFATGGPSPSAAPAPTSTPLPVTGSPSPLASPTGSGNVALNAACLTALATAQTVTADVSGFGRAAAHLDAAKLDAIVRQLQHVRPALSHALASCQSTISLPQVTPSPSPVFVPSH